VTNVWYQLNGGSWSNAVTPNRWTNWTATVSLIPGTNAIKAYAVDAANYPSPTNSVSFFYVVTNRLAVTNQGPGTVSPYTNNAWLELGRRYTNTAKASAGSVFTNWLVFTNGVAGEPSTSSNLVFFMQSNLLLQATFVDVQKPTNTITSPTNGQRFTTAVYTVRGTAKDNAGVTGVWYQFNTNAWSLAASTNGWTNWSATVGLSGGPNQVRAYAVDGQGNFSLTNSVTFTTTNAFRLQLSAGMLTTTGFDLLVDASPGIPGRLLVSTNLVDWVGLTNFVGTNSTLHFHDPTATNDQRRAYRAVTP
jgi:hypothetical protein